MKSKKIMLIMLVGAIGVLALTGCGMDGPIADVYEQKTQDDGKPFAHLITPYVGSAHQTHAVVNALQLPGENWIVSSIQIGQDHGDFPIGYSPYTLTVFYEPQQGSVINGSREYLEIPSEIFEANTNLLFDLIENLQAVTFSVRFVTSDDGNNDFFDYRWSKSRGGEFSLEIRNENESASIEIYIDLMRNVNLGFSILNEVNYNDAFEEIRSFRFDGEGERLVIWANRPIYNLSLIALEHDAAGFLVKDTVFTVDKLDSAAAEALVIDSYYGIGTIPWSGIFFEDMFGTRRYFMLQQSQFDGRFFLQEFEPVGA